MFVGIGVGIGRNRFAQGIFNAYNLRVVADGGITEAGNCVDAVSSLLQSASLLLIPSGYKGGKLYAEIPTNGNGDLTWTRASDAWRTNADGLIQRVPWNLLQYSEAFDNAYWSKISTSITANDAVSPNGTNTADLFVFTGTGYATSPSSILVNGTTYILSVYVRAKNTSGVVRLAQNTSVDTIVTSQTYSVDTNWQRISFTFTAGATSSKIAIAQRISGDTDYYYWGAQLVEGTTAQTYLPTTDRLNFPRLSYMYGSCPAVLLEPQRTNLLVRSNEFSNVGVWVNTNLTVSDNSQSGIDGNTTAALITTTSTLNLLNQQVAVTAGTVYTFSFYVKRGTMTDLKYRVRNVTGASDIIPPTSYYSQTNSATFTRISVTVTAPVGCTAITFYPFSDTGSIGTAILTQAQVEIGAYATTIIPTTSATATRVADSFSRSNIYTNGLISASGGTWFVELRNNISYTRDNTIGMFIGDGTSSNAGNQFIIRATSGGRLLIYKYVSGTGTSIYVTTTDTVKIAIKWDGTSADVFANGTKVVSSTSFTTTNMENLIGSVGIPVFIQQMALFPTPLSDTDCTTLTT